MNFIRRHLLGGALKTLAAFFGYGIVSGAGFFLGKKGTPLGQAQAAGSCSYGSDCGGGGGSCSYGSTCSGGGGACSYGSSCGGSAKETNTSSKSTATGTCSYGSACAGGGGSCSYGAACAGGGGKCSYGSDCGGK